ncbi:hypothetical protein B0H16DRAFT_1696698 [Mycena metata]|uniref:Uncharacterized protein n=1 Tax=Mycena metata TaxID=1033252 RepID=A0AAD7MTJ4_9AGAR|nr:hypothetical protein B0H16DRAFT_1696698 [Mycena metata]
MSDGAGKGAARYVTKVQERTPSIPKAGRRANQEWRTSRSASKKRTRLARVKTTLAFQKSHRKKEPPPLQQRTSVHETPRLQEYTTSAHDARKTSNKEKRKKNNSQPIAAPNSQSASSSTASSRRSDAQMGVRVSGPEGRVVEPGGGGVEEGLLLICFISIWRVRGRKGGRKEGRGMRFRARRMKPPPTSRPGLDHMRQTPGARKIATVRCDGDHDSRRHDGQVESNGRKKGMEVEVEIIDGRRTPPAGRRGRRSVDGGRTEALRKSSNHCAPDREGSADSRRLLYLRMARAGSVRTTSPRRAHVAPKYADAPPAQSHSPRRSRETSEHAAVTAHDAQFVVPRSTQQWERNAEMGGTGDEGLKDRRKRGRRGAKEGRRGGGGVCEDRGRERMRQGQGPTRVRRPAALSLAVEPKWSVDAERSPQIQAQALEPTPPHPPWRAPTSLQPPTNPRSPKARIPPDEQQQRRLQGHNAGRGLGGVEDVRNVGEQRLEHLTSGSGHSGQARRVATRQYRRKISDFWKGIGRIKKADSHRELGSSRRPRNYAPGGYIPALGMRERYLGKGMTWADASGESSRKWGRVVWQRSSGGTGANPGAEPGQLNLRHAENPIDFRQIAASNQLPTRVRIDSRESVVGERKQRSWRCMDQPVRLASFLPPPRPRVSTAAVAPSLYRVERNAQEMDDDHASTNPFMEPTEFLVCGADQVHISTGPWRIPILPDGKRRNKSTGCGVKVHASATQTGRRMGASDDAEAVVNQYIPTEMQSIAKYDSCGCIRTPFGGAICVSALGASHSICTRHQHASAAAPVFRASGLRVRSDDDDGSPTPTTFFGADPANAATRVNPVGRISHLRSCALIFHDIPPAARAEAPANEEEGDVRPEDVIPGAAALWGAFSRRSG